MSVTDLRTLILGYDDRQSRVIEVPQWGNTKIEVRSMSGRERARMLKESMDDEGNVDFEKLYPMLIIATVHDPETGDKVFTAADVNGLADKSGAALEYVGKVASELSGMDKESVDNMGKASSLDTLASTESDDSPST